jgi:hypothetical protein
MTHDYGKPGEFASIDEVAGQEPQPDTVAFVEIVKDLLDNEDTSDLDVVGPTVVTMPVGSALRLVITDVFGVEYEVFVRARS